MLSSRQGLRGTYAALLALLLAIVLLEPIWALRGVRGGLLWEGIYFFVMLTTLATAVRSAKMLRFMAVLAVLSEGSSLAAYVEGVPAWVGGAGALLRVLFLSLAAGVILRHVLSSRERVTLDTILGAICVYVLIGFSFGIIYHLVELHSPGSFQAHDEIALGGGALRVRTALFEYFSFVTLSTLGYGDITPVRPLARSLTMFEAMIGQFYIAIIVARLVALHLFEGTREREKSA